MLKVKGMGGFCLLYLLTELALSESLFTYCLCHGTRASPYDVSVLLYDARVNI